MAVRFLRKFELFEIIGLIASVAAAIVFFLYGSRLDKLVGTPAYHWHMLFLVAGIYGHFIPWALLVGAILLVVGAFWLRVRKREILQRSSFVLRVFLAYCMLLIVFRVVNFYVPVLHPGLRDTAIQEIDRVLFFGKDLSYWLQPLATKWLTNVLTGAYVSWFWLLFATLVLLVFAGRRAVTEYVLASLLAFYIGYLCYVLIPVIGPGYTLHYSTVLGDIAPRFTLQRLLIARDCFPSLHTAISVLMGIYIWRYQRKWAVVYFPLITLIIFATLYLRIHYGLDDIAGLALAVVVSQVAPVLESTWQNWRKTGISS